MKSEVYTTVQQVSYKIGRTFYDNIIVPPFSSQLRNRNEFVPSPSIRALTFIDMEKRLYSNLEF